MNSSDNSDKNHEITTSEQQNQLLETQIVHITTVTNFFPSEPNPDLDLNLSSSKSSSTKSRKSKISSNNSSINHGVRSGTPKRASAQSSTNTSIILNRPHSPNSWIEQIQFKAQYCHLRCNDYVSVINSPKSLDKVQELDRLQQQYKTKINIAPSSSAKPSQKVPSKEQINPITTIASVSPQVQVDTPTAPTVAKPTSQHHSIFRWNFPHVKLRNLFHAKSLDNILDKSSSIEVKEQQKGREQRSQSSTSHEIHRISILKAQEPPTKRVTIDTNIRTAGPSHLKQSRAHKILATSNKKSKRSSIEEESCAVAANIGLRKLQPSSSTSSSEGGFGGVRGEFSNGRGGGHPSTILPQASQSRKSAEQQQKQDSAGSSKTKNSRNTGVINSAQSDSCLNVLSVSVPKNSIIKKTESSSVLMPCCGNKVDNPRTAAAGQGQDQESEQNLRTQRSSPKENEIVIVRPSSSSATTVKKKTTFLKPINKVTPISDSEEVQVDMLRNNSSTFSARPKLVVASVGYLQRPMSPNPNNNNEIQTTTNISSHHLVEDNNDGRRRVEETGVPKSSTNINQSFKQKYHTNCGSSSSTSINNDNHYYDFNAAVGIGTQRQTKNNSHENRQQQQQQRGVPTRSRLKNDDSNNDDFIIGKGAAPGQLGQQQVKWATSSGGTEARLSSKAKLESQNPKRVFGVQDWSKNSFSPHATNSSGQSTTGDKMSDLQSPTYVKKTAGLFDPKVNASTNLIHRNSTTDHDPHHNGSSLQNNLGSNYLRNVKGEEHFIKIERNVNGNNSPMTSTTPSYLNVSKSVSGYHGLSYNSTTTSENSTQIQHHRNFVRNGSSSNGNGFNTTTTIPTGTTTSHLKSDANFEKNGTDSSLSSTGKKLSDLQSPTYVKKTVNMFNKIDNSNSSTNLIQRTTGSTNLTALMHKQNGSTSPNKFAANYLKNVSSDSDSSSTEYYIKIETERNEGNVISPSKSGEPRYRNVPIRVEGAQYSSPINKTTSTAGCIEHQNSIPNGTNSKNNNGDIRIPIQISTSQPSPPSKIANSSIESSNNVEKNGVYFLEIVAIEKRKIEQLINTATEQLNGLDSSSEESGRVRAAIGKAKLLIGKKFKQFEELCQTNMKEKTQGTLGEPFTTQNDDLAGFWDMVLIQVDQIHSMFKDLDPNNQNSDQNEFGISHESNQKSIAPRKEVTKKVGSPSKSTLSKLKPTASSSTPNARDEERKKLLAERRKAMKNQMLNGGDGNVTNGVTSSGPVVQIFVPESQ